MESADDDSRTPGCSLLSPHSGCRRALALRRRARACGDPVLPSRRCRRGIPRPAQMVGRERREPQEGPPPAIEHDPGPPTHSIIPSSKAPAVPLYSVTYQGIRIGSVAREPRRTHWVALSIIDNQAAKFATRLGARRPMTTPLSTEADREELDLLLRGFEISRMLRLVADLGVADKVPIDGHITVHDLAASCSVLPEPLLRILRALAAVRIFQLTLEGAVSHTPRSRLLRTDTPNSFHYSARFWTGRGSWRAWEELDAAMTGGIPHETAWGVAR